MGVITVKDSSYFYLIQKTATNEIYAASFDEFSAFPFMQSSADSSKFFRYISADPTSDIMCKIEYTIIQNPIPQFNYKYNYKLRKDVGIIQLTYNRTDGLSGESSKFTLNKFNQTTIVAAEPPERIITEPILEQNYPNPFNPETIITYQIPASDKNRTSVHVQLKVYDILGKEVALLADEYKPSGKYKAVFNTSKLCLASGVYFYSLTAGNFVSFKKMILIK